MLVFPKLGIRLRHLGIGLRLCIFKIQTGLDQKRFIFSQQLQRILQLHFPLCKGLAVFVDFRLGILQLFQGICQFCICLNLAVFIFLQAVLVFLEAIGIGLFRIRFQLCKPGQGNALQLGFQKLCQRIHGIGVFRAVNIPLPGHRYIDLRIVIHSKHFPGNIQITGDLTAAQCGATPDHIHVQRRTDIAHHRKAAAVQAFQRICIIAVADCKLRTKRRIICKCTVQQAFVSRLGHSAP